MGEYDFKQFRKVFVENISDNLICAGAKEGGRDSGGLLMVQLPNRRWIVAGIVSWVIKCGEKNRHGIYTGVDRYIQWIIENSDI